MTQYLFDPSAIHFDRVEDGAVYRVDLPGLRYDGTVLVTTTRHAAGDTERWIAEQLSTLASRNGYDVIRGRLYSTLDLRSAEPDIGPRPVEGEWVCEQHPDRPWPHGDCAGPGVPVWDACGDHRVHRPPHGSAGHCE